MDLPRTIVLEMKSEMTIKKYGGIIMKKVCSGVLAMVIALSLGTSAAFGAGPGAGCNYVDADGDGVCDNYGINCGCTGAENCGWNFVDEDGDGICDYYEAGQRGGNGRGRGCRGGRGR